MNIEDLNELFPNSSVSGKREIIEGLLPENFYVHHIDSHETPKGFRFQGCILYGDNREDSTTCLEMPLEVLKVAEGYRIIKNPDFLVWTVWFNV